MPHELKTGFLYFFQGFKMLLKPGIRAFVIIPFVISALVFISIVGPAAYYFEGLLDDLVNKLPDWLSFIYWIITPLLTLLLLFISAYLFSLVTNIIGAPFNSFLAEKTETLLTDKQSVPITGVSELMSMVKHSLKRELDKLAYYIPRLLVLLILTFIPGVNVISSFAWFVMGAWMLAIQYSDFAMDNNNINFKNMLLLLKKERFTALGFGLAVTLSLSIPLFNLLVMPAAVIGATIMWVDLHKTRTT